LKKISRDELIKKLIDFHITFIVKNDLSISYLDPEKLEELGDVGYAISIDLTTGIVWIKYGDVYIYDALAKDGLEEMKKFYMHYAISPKNRRDLKFEEWVVESDSKRLYYSKESR
jgi:hypothetical protein